MAITELVLILFIVARWLSLSTTNSSCHAAMAPPCCQSPAASWTRRRDDFRRPDGDSHLQQYCQPRRNNHHRLLSALALMGLYLFWIRTPRILFKRAVFFANVWIEYPRIKAMNLSEDGVLVMQLEQRRLLIRVRNIDDLEKYTNYSLPVNKLQI